MTAPAGPRTYPRRREVVDIFGPPVLVTLVGLVGACVFAVLPITALLLRAPWRSLFDLLGTSEMRTAMRLSLLCSTTAACISVLAGVPVAWTLARGTSAPTRWLRAILLLPMALPPVVGGVVLLLAFGRRGLVGELLWRTTGWSLPFTTAGAIMAETFVAMPFVIFAVEAALRSADLRPMEAAATLGASRWTIAARITFPTIRPALVSGAILAWGRALGEFGATIAFAGSVPGSTRTLPLEVFFALERNPEEAMAGSLLLLGIAVAAVAAGANVLVGRR